MRPDDKLQALDSSETWRKMNLSDAPSGLKKTDKSTHTFAFQKEILIGFYSLESTVVVSGIFLMLSLFAQLHE